MTQRGALIVVEGLDRAGKTSQCTMLLKALHGVRTRYQKFPDRTTPVGTMIDAYLRGQSEHSDHAIHLLFAANRWELAAQIRKEVEDGVTVIVDRYSFSGVVYSSAKEIPELSLEWAWQPETGLPRPDLSLFLTVSSTEAASRGGFGEERYETSAMQERVERLFSSLFDMKHGCNIHKISADASADEVHDLVLDPVLNLLASDKLQKPLGKMVSWGELNNDVSDR